MSDDPNDPCEACIEAGAAAGEAAAYQVVHQTNYGALVADPLVNPYDGSPLVVGAQYLNTVLAKVRVYLGSGLWSNDVSSSELASGDGANGVGFLQTGTGAVNISLNRDLEAKGLWAHDFGVKADGVCDDTKAWQVAIDAAYAAGRPLFFGDGITMIRPGKVELNPTGGVRPPGGQWAHVKGFIGSARGDGNSGGMIFKVIPGTYTADLWAIKGNNSASVTVENVTVDLNGQSVNGINLAWLGSGPGNVAPANRNIISRIICKGALGGFTSINLDQVFDSEVVGILSLCASADAIGLSMKSGGGSPALRDSTISLGVLQIEAQNATFNNVLPLGGVVLSGTSRNSVGFVGGQIGPNATTKIFFNSTASGNATQCVTVKDCYLLSTNIAAPTLFAGNWRAGAILENVQAVNSDYVMFGTITGLAGQIFKLVDCNLGFTPNSGALVELENTIVNSVRYPWKMLNGPLQYSGRQIRGVMNSRNLTTTLSTVGAQSYAPDMGGDVSKHTLNVTAASVTGFTLASPTNAMGHDQLEVTVINATSDTATFPISLGSNYRKPPDVTLQPLAPGKRTNLRFTANGAGVFDLYPPAQNITV